MIEYRQIAEQLISAARELDQKGLTAGTWGNLSVRLPDDNIVITPSGMEYASLTEKDFVLLSPEGKVLSGCRKPSSELALHVRVYAARTDFCALVHTHSPYATALAAARKEIPPIVEDLVQIVGGGVRVGKYALPGTEELARNLVEALQDRTAALMANHGVICGGASLKEALKTSIVVEKAAEITLLSGLAGGAVALSEEDIKQMRDFYLNGYGQRE